MNHAAQFTGFRSGFSCFVISFPYYNICSFYWQVFHSSFIIFNSQQKKVSERYETIQKFLRSTYAKYILPGVLLQSVLIGGGYATGREIYSYGAKFGAMGWISGLTIASVCLFAFLTFEICRIYKVYDYKNYIKQVIGPLWPMMDILTVLIAILLIAVMAAATGSIFEQVGLPNILGSVVIVLICGLLNFKGSKMIEKFESIGTILLYGGYILFTILVLVNKGGNISHVFSTMDTSTYDGSVTVPLCIYTGILYVAYNINSIPMGMFSLTRQTKRKETFISGLIAGLLMVIPWFCLTLR